MAVVDNYGVEKKDGKKVSKALFQWDVLAFWAQMISTRSESADHIFFRYAEVLWPPGSAMHVITKQSK
jgi:hypothetical protein